MKDCDCSVYSVWVVNVQPLDTAKNERRQCHGKVCCCWKGGPRIGADSALLPRRAGDEAPQGSRKSMPISLPSEICFSRPSTDICFRSCSSREGKLLRLGSAKSPLPAQSVENWALGFRLQGLGLKA